ncbi:MAG: TIGR02587 family membrane protein [Phenylobacterium sp.]|nr:TIGR02587 family membrane protein [Phenylobacterium sp.]
MATQARQEESYLRGLARASAGALIFGFPLLMTMEMWAFGAHMGRWRLATFVLVTAGVVYGLNRFAGFRDETSPFDDLLDTASALLVGFVVSTALLALFGLIGPQTALREGIGMVAVQAAPASMGAMLANKQLQQDRPSESKEDRAGYLGQLFLMGAGALFLAFNVAPTEEMLLIGFRMGAWHAVALVLVSLAALHALVFTVGFAGQHESEGHLKAFARFTLAGYGLALLVSLYVLWTFGRLDGGMSEAVRSVVVLGFPAAIGAAIARLVV